MRCQSVFRAAVTLIEFLVAVGIVGLLTGLLLAAVIKVREAALAAQSRNNLRQIGLATQHYAGERSSRLPVLDGNRRGPNRDLSVLNSLLPYLEQPPGPPVNPERPGGLRVHTVFHSPADPTLADSPSRGAGLSSYAANATVFLTPASLSASFRDGTSTTIMYAEHYAYNCQGHTFYAGLTTVSLLRRASFADTMDVRPVITGSPPVTGPSFGRLTFQAAPRRADCIPSIPQTPHRNGMIVGLADGSVRTIAPSIEPVVFWSSVTPAAGEAFDGQW